ncbi:MAG: hypothetical protein WCK84_10495 [Bacteroidota bacterium]
MKNNQTRKNDVLTNRMNQANHRLSVPNSKLLTGSVTDKFPIVLDGGKTIIFISDKERESEIRARYGVRRR